MKVRKTPESPDRVGGTLVPKPMRYAMYCENGDRIDFVDPNTGEREAVYIGDFVPKLLDADADGNPIPLAKFCAKCGAKTMSKCQDCGACIRCDWPHKKPNYCTDCGAAFPWVATALQELGRVTDEEEGLSEHEKAALKLAYPELTKDTPKTSGAIGTLKRLYEKFSGPTMSVVRPVLINILTDEGKKDLSSFLHHHQ